MGEQTAREAVDACTLVEDGGGVGEVSPGASRRGFLEEVNAALCVITGMEGGPRPCPAQVQEGGDFCGKLLHDITDPVDINNVYRITSQTIQIMDPH